MHATKVVAAMLVACSATDEETDPETGTVPETDTDPDSGPDPDTATDSGSETGTTAPGPENVLLVLLDDLGTELLGIYGAVGGPPTPTLDALAAEGLAFDAAWATPLCSPTRAALLTGRYPTRTGVGMVVEYIPLGGTSALPYEERTIPEVLAAAAAPWATSMVGKWHLSLLGTLGDPGLQGFAWHSGSPGNIGNYEDWDEDRNGVSIERTTYATTDTADDAIARIGEMTEPWFLYAAFNAPHSPYHEPPEALAPGTFGTDEEKYAAMITSVDAELGRVLAAMAAEQRARTTVIVVGDNGTPLEVIGGDDHRFKGSVYEGGVRVPLVVTGPRVGTPGSRSDALVSVVDVLPTVAEIAGVELGPDPIDGLSLLPVLADPTLPVHETVYTEVFTSDTSAFALRDPRWKLSVSSNWGFGYPDRTGTELYDLDADPGETVDLADDPAYEAERIRLEDLARALQASMRSE